MDDNRNLGSLNDDVSIGNNSPVNEVNPEMSPDAENDWTDVDTSVEEDDDDYFSSIIIIFSCTVMASKVHFLNTR